MAKSLGVLLVSSFLSLSHLAGSVNEYPEQDRTAYPALFRLPDECYEVVLDKPLGIAFEEGNDGGVVADVSGSYTKTTGGRGNKTGFSVEALLQLTDSAAPDRW